MSSIRRQINACMEMLECLKFAMVLPFTPFHGRTMVVNMKRPKMRFLPFHNGK